MCNFIVFAGYVSICKKGSKSRIKFLLVPFLARNPSLWVQSCTISTISFKFNYCMLLALMKHHNQPSAEQTFHPLSPSLAIRLNGLIPTMTTEAQKMGACSGLTKYPCNRRHQIQLRCSSCNTHVECGVSFLHIYKEIQLWLKRLGVGLYLVRKISIAERRT